MLVVGQRLELLLTIWTELISSMSSQEGNVVLRNDNIVLL